MKNSNLENDTEEKITEFESKDKHYDIQNLLGSDVKLYTSDYSIILFKSNSKAVTIRLKKEKETLNDNLNILVLHKIVENLPKEAKDVYYIVPEDVQRILPKRRDLLSICEPVYKLGDTNEVIGYSSLCRLE